MRIWLTLLAGLIACSANGAETAAERLAGHLPSTPALVVVACSEGGSGTVAEIVERTPWTVLCRGTQQQDLDEIRRWARGHGLLGKRVFVVESERKPGTPAAGTMELSLADEMADAVWVEPGLNTAPSEEEILRVLRPGGVGLAAGRVFVKPTPEGVDQWRHPYHAPDNNIVSRDRVARLPGELRFQAQPVFAAMPNQTLFAGGRIFFFTGHIAFHEREEPMLNRLTVLNAYNGLEQWSRPLDPRYVVHNVAKLATDTEVVFAEGPKLWVLDAATGQPRGEFTVPPEAAAAGDTDWKWIAHDGNTLWAAWGPPDGRVAPLRRKQRMGHWPWNIANEQYREIVENFGAARRLAAYEYPEMKLRWSIAESEPFDVRTLCMQGGRIFQLAPQQYAAARDAETGGVLWRQTPETSGRLFAAIGEAVRRQGWGLGWATYCCARAAEDVVCIAGPPYNHTICVDLTDGTLLWSSADQSPHPFFLDEALYLMPRVAGPAAGCRKIDPQTGRLLDDFSLGVIGSCTRLTVTPSQFYYRPGGGEGRTVYFDLEAGELAAYEGIVRPGCFDGVVPANGRLYWMPLACDCWQVHGTFSMAPREPVSEKTVAFDEPVWETPVESAPAAPDDWPMFRADAVGSATVAVSVPRQVRELWSRKVTNHRLTAPVSVGGRVLVGSDDGSVQALDAGDGTTLWTAFSSAAVLYPPACWNGRAVFGSCDGTLVSLDASNGNRLGSRTLAPAPRFVNIMGQLMSAWPLGGGVIVDDQGTAYAAAGSTAADGTVAVAVDLATGRERWRRAYTLDGEDSRLSFGVQSNLLARSGTLYINGGAPVGIVGLDANTGGSPRVVARLEAGMEMFLEPDGTPSCSGPELYCQQSARTTIFKRHQNHVYFRLADRNLALIDGRVFCAVDREPLDAIVRLMNTDPQTGGRMGGGTVPWDVRQVPLDDSILWASEAADVRGVAVGTDGLVVIREECVEALSSEGTSLWTASLSAPPVRWGLALAAEHCVVTLTDGTICCVGR